MEYSVSYEGGGAGLPTTVACGADLGKICRDNRVAATMRDEQGPVIWAQADGTIGHCKCGACGKRMSAAPWLCVECARERAEAAWRDGDVAEERRYRAMIPVAPAGEPLRYTVRVREWRTATAPDGRERSAEVLVRPADADGRTPEMAASALGIAVLYGPGARLHRTGAEQGLGQIMRPSAQPHGLDAVTGMVNVMVKKSSA